VLQALCKKGWVPSVRELRNENKSVRLLSPVEVEHMRTSYWLIWLTFGTRGWSVAARHHTVRNTCERHPVQLTSSRNELMTDLPMQKTYVVKEGALETFRFTVRHYRVHRPWVYHVLLASHLPNKPARILDTSQLQQFDLMWSNPRQLVVCIEDQ